MPAFVADDPSLSVEAHWVQWGQFWSSPEKTGFVEHGDEAKPKSRSAPRAKRSKRDLSDDEGDEDSDDMVGSEVDESGSSSDSSI